mmetsp:Transcript_22481/g.57462  ORF Transcript_22481/g.57462 Transcript_22481/m.57462 type:complete len:204 (-) Transcript_22481:16-627(-)
MITCGQTSSSHSFSFSFSTSPAKIRRCQTTRSPQMHWHTVPPCVEFPVGAPPAAATTCRSFSNGGPAACALGSQGSQTCAWMKAPPKCSSERGSEIAMATDTAPSRSGARALSPPWPPATFSTLARSNGVPTSGEEAFNSTPRTTPARQTSTRRPHILLHVVHPNKAALALSCYTANPSTTLRPISEGGAQGMGPELAAPSSA